MANSKYINLDRHFVPWNDQNEAPLDYLLFSGLQHGALNWSALLNSRRIVVLAEAGCGKSTEFRTRTAQLIDEGKFAFYATVQDVAKDGLEAALGSRQRGAFQKWRASGEPAYFFIDSVDEAKLDRIRFGTAVRKLADGIEVGKDRAYIAISSRITDWEKKNDLEEVISQLPLPEPPPVEMPFEQALKDILNGENTEKAKPTKPETEAPLVVVMGALDRDRVRIYAYAHNVESVEEFLSSLDAANLWLFARRPADLDWLIAYWRKHKAFAPFAQMLEFSLRERLSDLNRASFNPLSEDKSMHALERIGAAMVFGRFEKIAIPDSEEASPQQSLADIAKILPDWPVEHIKSFLSKAVFDPASFGTVRIHGDNQGDVRAFLAARWLQRRSAQPNFSYQERRALLFADTYGERLVKPSVEETAAWLSIYDADTANEVMERNPALLLRYGDPASLSLSIRTATLKKVVERIAGGESAHGYDRNALARFSTPELLPEIKRLWTAHKVDPSVRSLLLQMLANGKLSGADDIVQEAVFGGFSDVASLVHGGRILMATGSVKKRKEYAKHVVENASKLEEIAVWDAIDEMFLEEISIDDLFGILDSLRMPRNHAYQFTQSISNSVERLIRKDDAIKMLQGFLKRLSGSLKLGEYRKPDGTEVYDHIVGAIAAKVIGLSAQNDVPEVAAMAAFRLYFRNRHRHTSEQSLSFTNDLRSNAARRRRMFLLAIDFVDKSDALGGRSLQAASQIEFSIWNTGFGLEDVDWLIEQTKNATDDNRALVFLTAALGVWRDNGRQQTVLDKIGAVAELRKVTLETLEAWKNPDPNVGMDDETLRSIEQSRRQAERQRTKRDKSWIQFLANLRDNPKALRDFKPDKPGGVDSRLVALWELLNSTNSQSTRYAVDSVDAVRLIFGDALADEFRAVLVEFWRGRRPTLVSERQPDQKNTYSKLDCMAIAAISLEAKSDPRWASKLTAEEAVAAAEFATLELNGFPFWFSQLVATHPEQVSKVLVGEVKATLDEDGETARHGVIQDILHATPDVSETVANDLFRELESRPNLREPTLGALLSIVATGLTMQRERFGAFCIQRFLQENDPGRTGLYLAAAFATYPAKAIEALSGKLKLTTHQYQRPLFERLLPNMFGDGMMKRRIERPDLPLDVLAQIVEVAYRTVRLEEDNSRPSGEVYSPNERDNAERARGYAFELLRNKRGYPVYALFRKWSDSGTLEFPPNRLREMAYEKAAEDSEHSPWELSEAFQLEGQFDVAPVTPADLIGCARRRLLDIQHDLHHADFAQGPTLKRQPNEVDVQIWVASELSHREARAYSVERESEVVDGKAPDIRLRAKASSASVPIEIKVAEDNTLPELENALKVQLVGRYLRHKDAMHGVLLLVHKDARPIGWTAKDGSMLNFGHVVEHLRGIAKEMAEGFDAPQAIVEILDVSDVLVPKLDIKSKAIHQRKAEKKK